MQTSLSKYLTYKQVMNCLNIGLVNTIHKMIADGLPVIIIGRLKRVDRCELGKYLASKSNKKN